LGADMKRGSLAAVLADRIPNEAASLGRMQMPQLVGNGSRVISSW